MGASFFSGLSSDDRYMFQVLKGIFVWVISAGYDTNPWYPCIPLLSSFFLYFSTPAHRFEVLSDVNKVSWSQGIVVAVDRHLMANQIHWDWEGEFLLGAVCLQEFWTFFCCMRILQMLPHKWKSKPSPEMENFENLKG